MRHKVIYSTWSANIPIWDPFVSIWGKTNFRILDPVFLDFIWEDSLWQFQVSENGSGGSWNVWEGRLGSFTGPLYGLEEAPRSDVS